MCCLASRAELLFQPLISSSQCWSLSSPVAAEWLAGVGTLVLAFVAVFQEWLRRLVVRPRLKLNARVRRPDSEKTKGNEITPAYYFRLAVTNEGNAEARDVQLYSAAVERVGLDKQPRPVEQFTPMNLQWAYMKGSPTVPVLLPKMPPKLCDLAHI